MGRYHVEKDPHRGVGNTAEFEFVLAHQADGLAKGGIDFGDQGKAQGVHVGEVPVEASGDDTCRPGDFSQADAAEAATTLHELAGGIEQGLAGL
ncbi:hypothetical protein D3C73_1519710 [compost metagenome]